MCIKDGAPVKPGKQTDEQKGMQKLWEFLRSHDAVFLGSPTLKKDLEQFLKDNKIRTENATPQQEKYNRLIAAIVDII